MMKNMNTKLTQKIEFYLANPQPTADNFAEGTYYTRSGSDPYVYTKATTFVSGTDYYSNLLELYPYTKIENVEGLEEELKKALNLYNSSETYAIGDIVINPSKTGVYRCTTADTTGTWDATKWELIATKNYNDLTNKPTIDNNNQTVKTNNVTFGANDAVEIKAGSNVTVTGDSAAKTITIASSYTDTNQKIKSGSTTFGADDVIDIVGGTNVTVTPATTGTGAPKITISSTDTGATSIETTGAGNAVTSGSYDASTRKITLTKGTTFLTSHQSIKTLDTTATSAQSTNNNEAIAGSGKITLHKVSKTGTYSDLIGTPTKTSDFTNDGDGTNAFITNATAQINESQVNNLENDLQNIREVAEGKTATYVISSQSDITGTKDAGTENYTNVTAITGVTIADLHIGDNIFLTTTDQPDYWVSQLNKTGDVVTSVSLNKLETTKADLTKMVETDETALTADKIALGAGNKKVKNSGIGIHKYNNFSASDDTNVSTDKAVASYVSTNYQPLDADLTAVAGLTGTGYAKRTGNDTWALDTNVVTASGTLTSGQILTGAGDKGAQASGVSIETSSTSTLTNVDTKVPTTKVLTRELDKKLDDSQLVTSWSGTVADTNIPSEKLVKDALDGKLDKSMVGYVDLSDKNYLTYTLTDAEMAELDKTYCIIKYGVVNDLPYYYYKAQTMATAVNTFYLFRCSKLESGNSELNTIQKTITIDSDTKKFQPSNFDISYSIKGSDKLLNAKVGQNEIVESLASNYVEASPQPTSNNFITNVYYTRSGSEGSYTYTLASSYASGTTYYVKAVASVDALNTALASKYDTVSTSGSGNVVTAIAENVTNSNQIDVTKGITAIVAGSTDKVQLTGDVTSSATTLSSGTTSITTTLANSGVTAGTYSAVQVNAKGIVTNGGQFVEVDSGTGVPSDNLVIGGIFFKEI